MLCNARIFFHENAVDIIHFPTVRRRIKNSRGSRQLNSQVDNLSAAFGGAEPKCMIIVETRGIQI